MTGAQFDKSKTENYGFNSQGDLSISTVESICKGQTYAAIEDTIGVERITKRVNGELVPQAISPVIDGTAQGTPKKILDRQKVFISDVPGVINGVYFADIYETSGTIILPTGAIDVEFYLPDVCGYSDWASREEGVLKTTVQTKKGNTTTKKVKWSFYTMVLVYNSVGAQMWRVLPEDGAKILLPYRFIY